MVVIKANITPGDELQTPRSWKVIAGSSQPPPRKTTIFFDQKGTPDLLPTYSEVVPIYDTKKAVIQRSPGTVPGKWARNCCSRAVSCSIPGKLMPVENGSLDPITAVNSNQNHQPSAKAQSGSANAATSPVLGVALLKL